MPKLRFFGVRNMKTWPILYSDVLRLGNLESPVGVATMWTERQAVAKVLEGESYAVIGNLYSTAGISPMIRNIFAKPTINKIILWGADLSGSGSAFLNFMQNGVDKDHQIKGAENGGLIEKEIDHKSLELFRKSVKIINLKGKPVDELKKTVSQLSKTGRHPAKGFVKPKLFPTQNPKPFTYPSEQSGYIVNVEKAARGWLKLLNLIMRYGRIKKTRYSQNNELKEILNLTVTVTNEDPDNFYFPNYLLFTKKELETYLPQVLTPQNIPGISYSYGQRLRDNQGIDQIQEIIELAKRRPFSKKMAAFTANISRDWGRENIDRGDTPCLTQVLCSIQDGKLLMTTHFRSQDMVHGWPRNVFSLIKLQALICQEAKVERGSFTMMTHSAHIYADDFKKIEKILAENFEKELGFTARQHFRNDPRGNYTVEVDRKNKLILVKLFAPDGGLMLKQWHGENALDLIWEITDWDYFAMPGHAMYVGAELQRAEEALLSGKPYTQDRP